MKPIRFAAIVVAAGRGTRFGRAKQFVDIAGKPMVEWSIETFASFDELGVLIVVTERDLIERMRALMTRIAPRCPWTVLAGGLNRQESVARGLGAVPQDCLGVFIHDGARPLVRADDVRAGMAAVRPGKAAVLATPMVDTVKLADSRGSFVKQTLERQRLWAAQTPQFAMRDDVLRAHETARRDRIDATDDAALLERIGVKVALIAASTENFKVTVPEDLERAELLLRGRIARVDVSP